MAREMSWLNVEEEREDVVLAVGVGVRSGQGRERVGFG